MKKFCVGGALSGFDSEELIERPSELDDKLESGERVIIIAHGQQYVADPADRSRSILDPNLLKHNLHAFVITHSGHQTSPEELKRHREDLKEKCQRVFGVSCGWNRLEDDHIEKVLNFLKTDDSFPYDSDVQMALGFGAPVAGLALRAALEIALIEINARKPDSVGKDNISNDILLAPAFEVASRKPSLNHAVNGIRQALGGPEELLREEIDSTLAALRSAPAERN